MDFSGSAARSKCSSGRATPFAALLDNPAQSSCPFPKSFVVAVP
jgi:hypothetical protein